MHKDTWLQTVKAYVSSNVPSGGIQSFFLPKISSRARDIYEWMLGIVEHCLPFSFVENEWARRNLKVSWISRPSLMKMLTKTSNLVAKKIRDSLPPTLGIVIDGWSEGTTHYVAVFCTFFDDRKKKVVKYLLSMAPMGDETSFTADAHKDYIEWVVQVYD